MNMNINRGDIFYLNIEKNNDSRIQGGVRPILIVSNNMCNKHSPVVHYIPLTSKMKKRALPTHVKLSGYGLKFDSVALCEQTSSTDTYRLREKVGSVSDEAMKKIEHAIMIQFGLCS